MLVTILLYFLVGAVGGTMAGLLGIGGGLVLVPCLAYLFLHHGIAQDFAMHMAVATTLMITVFTSTSAIRAHLKRGTVLMDVFKQMVLGLIIGAALGAVVADFLPGRFLEILFGVFAVFLAIRMGLAVRDKPLGRLPGKAGLLISGLILSFFSSLVGLSGGVLIVPFLSRCNVPMKQTVSTSAVCTLPIALAGGLSFLITGLTVHNLPPWSIGYVYIPALIAVATMSMLFAPVGARLAHRLKPHILRRVFAVFLLLVGLNMLFFK